MDRALKAHRLRLGLSRRVLAERTGLNPYTVRYWERKPRVDLRGIGPGMILDALGLGDVVARARAERTYELGVFSRSLSRARYGVLVGNGSYGPSRVACGAKTRKGSACRAKPEPGKRRRRFHGGRSTGPRTTEGRARIAEAQQRQWAKYRAKRDSEYQ